VPIDARARASESDGSAPDAWPKNWETLGAAWRDLLALAHMEHAVLLMSHKRTAPASVELAAAKRALGVRLTLDGALGRRTKHQEKAYSLLILRVTCLPCAPPRDQQQLSEEAAAASTEAAAAAVPTCVVEEDDELLREPVYETSASAGVLGTATEVGSIPHGSLRALEQQLVLAECEWVLTSRPSHDSAAEEMEPYLRAALALPRRWVTSTHALRLKARLESARKRRRHQSLMQLETLVDDVRPSADGAEGTFLSRHVGLVASAGGLAPASAPAPSPDVSEQPVPESNAATAAASTMAAAAKSMDAARLAERLRGFWAVPLGARWQLGAELARTLAALGLLTEAAKLFEELELWEECVLSLSATGHAEDAERLVRKRLSVEPTAAMWVNLGDLTSDVDCYGKAWELSGGTCARAKLKLGSHAMKSERYAEAREHLQAALRVKAHYADAWYCCAVCLLKLDDTDGALAEMRKVIAIDPTHTQAWSALGGLFAKKRMKQEALYAFREACKLRCDSWQLWQHTALAALDLGRFDETVYSARQSLKFGGQPAPQISSLVSQAIARDLKDTADGTRARHLLPQARELLADSCAREPTNAIHWEARVHLEKRCNGDDGDGASRRCLEEQLAAYKKHTAWKTKPDALEAVTEVAAQLVEALLETGEASNVKTARKLVEGLLHAASEHLAATEGCEQLRMLMAKIVRHDDD
jgi:tetratricopeptide (TPR) repeat protein